MKRLIIILLSLIFLFPADIDARKKKTGQASQKPKTERTAAQVKEEKKQNEQRIRQAREKINENRQRTSRQLNALNSLNGQIIKQTADIDQLSQSIATLDSLAAGISDTIAIIEADVQTLRRNYANSLRRQRDARQGLSTASLIFSSESFYQAMKRLEYIKQLEKWRNEKSERLRSSVDLLNLKRAGLTDLRKKHAIAVNNLNTGRRRLQDKKNQTEKLVASLKKETASLESELKDRQKRARVLDAELDRIIAEEMRRAEAERLAAEKAAREKAERERLEREKAERERIEREKKDKEKPNVTTPATPATPAKPPVVKPTPEEQIYTEKAAAERKLTGSFEQNKGRLLFPIAGSYNVVGNFGRSQHANLSRIEIENSGIDIETAPGTNARAIYDGTISSIFYMDGYHNIVMVRHGEYLSVYTHLDRLSVKKGDKVKAGQNLGHIFSDPADDNRTMLHFEVRKERTKLNPLDWVK